MWVCKLYASNWDTECGKLKGKLQPSKFTKGMLATFSQWSATDVNKLNLYLGDVMQKYWFGLQADESPHAEDILRDVGHFFVKVSKRVLIVDSMAKCQQAVAKSEHSLRRELASRLPRAQKDRVGTSH